MKKVVKIKGMSCNHCKERIEKSLIEIKEIKDVAVDLQKGEAIIDVDCDLSENVYKGIIEELGYEVVE